MKSVLRNLLFVLVIVSLISCVSGTQTLTAVPSSTPVASVTPTFTSEPTSTPTERPKSAVDEIFALPTIGIIPGETPTPIATPAFQDTSANLREMSEKNYLELIRRMNDYSYENYPPDGWWLEGNFSGSQTSVALVIQEYLYRFPNSPNAERLRWQLALINSIAATGGNQYGDAWMLSELQRRLEQGETSPDHLEEILGQYSFEVAYFQPVENLFQDGKTGWLYGIAPLILKDYWFTENSGLFFVVREIDENDSQIILLNSVWNFSFGDSYVFEVSDHNQNGTPEIALYEGAHSGTMCSGNLLIYEWDKSAFMELTKGKVEIRNCFDEYKYYMDRNGKPSILISSNRSPLFVWNGKYYEFNQFLESDLFEVWLNSVFDKNFPRADEPELLKEVLASWKPRTHYGPAYPDYLRYRLGFIYALQSMQDKAINELNALILTPVDETRKIFPDMAGKFLEHYTGDESIYNACRQSNSVYEKALDPYRDSDGNVSNEVFGEVLGLSMESYSLFSFSLCDEKQAFMLMADSIPSSVTDLPDKLSKNGSVLKYSKKLDINIDGKVEEWLIVIDKGIYAVFPNGPFYETVELDWLAGDVPSYSKAKVEIGKWNGIQEPVLTIFNEHDLRIIRIGDDYSPVSMDFEFEVKDVAFLPNSNPPQYQVSYLKPASENNYSDGPWKGYRWDAAHKKFRDDLFEYSLFIEHDFKRAAEIADVVAPLILEWADVDDFWHSRPNYLYLCGLSYELAGDKKAAAKIYWQLWHDFPESQYALIAKYKLETVTP